MIYPNRTFTNVLPHALCNCLHLLHRESVANDEQRSTHNTVSSRKIIFWTLVFHVTYNVIWSTCPKVVCTSVRRLDPLPRESAKHIEEAWRLQGNRRLSQRWERLWRNATRSAQVTDGEPIGYQFIVPCNHILTECPPNTSGPALWYKECLGPTFWLQDTLNSQKTFRGCW
ncbi:hypothetical protein BC629DRAFT_1438973 [Irpex lacteus]|nr:hypothetical protein BC629DRAFT_1438973 [Irpex lacteus]